MFGISNEKQKRALLLFLDMQIEQPTDSLEENLIYRFPSLTIKDRIKNILGLPKSIHGEYVDNEQYSWPSSTLLCAVVFLEDAVNYKSIVHKVTQKYLLIYQWFSSPMIKKLHQIILIINLCLAFFERPSSFSDTSDVRYKPNRIVFPYFILMMMEGLTLFWFFFLYISMKIACIGVKPSRKRFWMVIFLIVTIYSLCEWSIMFIFLRQTYTGIRFRRLFRPIFMIESSQLMKKTLKAVQKNLLTIIACISLALFHILFFAVMAMFLFPRSSTEQESQGNTYFSNLHDSVFNLLILYSTANNPDVMMPAYSDYRLNVLFFIVFVVIGIYCIQNIITAVVYRAFRGYFLNSIINSQLRRRTAIRASFEVLRKRVSSEGFIETKDTVPILVIQKVLNSVTMNKWHCDRINQRLNELLRENATINLDEYSKTMQLLDLNPKLAADINIPALGNNLIDRLKAIGRSKAFDLIGTIFAILSVIFITVEISDRRLNIDDKNNVPFTLSIAFINLSFLIFFVLEIVVKAWAFGPVNFFRSSSEHIFEAAVAFTSFFLQVAYMIIRQTAVIDLTSVDMVNQGKSVFSLWAAIKICNMLFIYRLIRFLPASKNIRIIVGTVFDQLRNGGAFYGVLFSCYYAYSMLGMELFGGAVDELYKNYNESNPICGTYEQLEYWPNGFDDFYSSFITLYNIMIVNQWFVFVIGFRTATKSLWSELYFIFWYLFVTTIGLNICLALNGDIHDAKKQRAEQQQELIVSNMYDIYRSQIKEPLPEEITEGLKKNPYMNFHQDLSEGTNRL